MSDDTVNIAYAALQQIGDALKLVIDTNAATLRACKDSRDGSINATIVEAHIGKQKAEVSTAFGTVAKLVSARWASPEVLAYWETMEQKALVRDRDSALLVSRHRAASSDVKFKSFLLSVTAPPGNKRRSKKDRPAK